MLELLAFAVIGLASGFFAGLLGIGGGLIIVPALYAWLLSRHPEQAMHVAVATSLATIVFTAASSVHAHHRHGAVDWPLVKRLAPGLVAGSLLAALGASSLSGPWLAVVFGVFCLFAGTHMLRLRPAPAATAIPAGLSVAGAVIGAISAVVGIGGGTLTVPYLHTRGIDMHRAVATSAACGLPIAVAGMAGFMGGGWEAGGLPSWTVGFVWLPAVAVIGLASVVAAPLGAHTAHRTSRDGLRRVFASFLLLLGVVFLVRQGLGGG